MRWSPGPISPNLEDRRFQWENDPEGKLTALRNAVVQGDFADPNAGFDPSDLPPWMWPQAPTQEAAVGGQHDPAVLAFLQMLGGR